MFNGWIGQGGSLKLKTSLRSKPNQNKIENLWADKLKAFSENHSL